MHNHWQSVALTDVGHKRKENQDAIYADDNQRLWLVSDGMGGHAEGAAASQAIVDALRALELSPMLTERLVQIQQALRQVNSQLQQHAASQLQGQQTGATVVLLTECDGLAALLWVGDSRCYRKEPQRLQQLSWDHSHLREMVRDGYMTEQEAAVSKLSNVITRAIGPHVDVFFDFIVFRLRPEDCFLLCSDGLTNELTEGQIYAELERQSDLSVAAAQLMAATLQKGARDNVSIVLVQSHGPLKTVSEDAPVSAWNKHVQELNLALFQHRIDLVDYYKKISAVIPAFQSNTVMDNTVNSARDLSRASTLEMKIIQPEQAILPTSAEPKSQLSGKSWIGILLSTLLIGAVVLFLI